MVYETEVSLGMVSWQAPSEVHLAAINHPPLALEITAFAEHRSHVPQKASKRRAPFLTRL